jgi:manganese-dependent inorganic pyrophosphatase
MKEILVFGHKNPDTDTICSSIAMAELQKKVRGEEIIPCRLGNINEETRYALEHFKVETPKFIDKIENDQVVIMVDHNEFTQSVEGIENAKIDTVIDHHRINNFRTSEPLFYYSQPVGCTATLLYELYTLNNIEIETKIAGLMASAIISDTLLLKSPTTTEKDKKALSELAKIANINIEEYGLEMLKAGTNLDKYTEAELIELDAKSADINGIKYIIAQVNTISIDDVLKRKEKIEDEMERVIAEKGLGLFMFVITDIINSNSKSIVLGNRKDIVAKTYEIKENIAVMPGVVSRKKQLLPIIEKNA